MKLYGVVTMDIVGSRKANKRADIQENLDRYITYMNNKHGDILTAPICFTLGDEWQLISHEPSQCYNLIHEFQQLLWKDHIDFYAGIGIGPLSTQEYQDIRKMDGPCFLAAREAINVTKNQARMRNKHIHSKNNRVYFKSWGANSNNESDIFYQHALERYQSQSSNRVLDEVALTSVHRHDISLKLPENLTLENTINVIIENNEILKSRMTQKQRRTYLDYMELGSYREMAKNCGENSGMSIGGISQKLNNAEYFTIQRNHEMVTSLLSYYCLIRGV